MQDRLSGLFEQPMSVHSRQEEILEELIGQWGFTSLLFRIAGILKQLTEEQMGSEYGAAARRVDSCAKAVRSLLKGE